MVVLGSSVARGVGAAPLEQNGWSRMLEKAARRCNVTVSNHCIDGTTVDSWKRILAEQTAEKLRGVDVAVMALSLGNEGLALALTTQKISELERHYLDGLHEIVRRLREVLPEGARLVLGGPYPHGLYKRRHLETLQRTLAQMESWKEVDHVIDFLCPGVVGEEGEWAKGMQHDPAHPNNDGHKRMFACVNVADVLGCDAGTCGAAGGECGAIAPGASPKRTRSSL